MLLFSETKSNCTGCTACMAVCPVNCIIMKKDEEGFLYPTIISDKCIHCNKCEQVCPIKNKESISYWSPKKAFAALTKNNETWIKSSSGGAFSEIAKIWGKDDINEIVIVGAAWNGFDVQEECIYGIDNIASLCKSKYIASDFREIIKEIKKIINEKKKKVVFCGTPCQVAGLKRSFKTEVPQLLTIDLICHGVGSPEVFKKSLEKIEKQFGKKIINYEFRTKRKKFETPYLSKITFIDRTVKYLINDPYMQLFLNQDCVRPSCHQNCIFHSEKRQGDLTISDFKGLTKVFSKLIEEGEKNYSAIIINSEKGEKLISELKASMQLLPVDLNIIKKFNPLFYRQSNIISNRDQFFKDYIENPDDCLEKYTINAVVYNPTIFKKIYFLFPYKLKLIIFKLYHKLKKYFS